MEPTAYSSLTLAQLTREHDVNNYTGLSVESFKLLFDHVKEKAAIMHYWRGLFRTGCTFGPFQMPLLPVVVPLFPFC